MQHLIENLKDISDRIALAQEKNNYEEILKLDHHRKLIVEDIFDTGLTLSHLKNLLESRNPKSIEILCMFVKKDISTEPVDIKYSGFEIGPEFVVGYGLDYEGKYRELPFLGVLS